MKYGILPTITIPVDIVLTDIGKESDGATLSEVVEQVWQAILKSAGAVGDGVKAIGSFLGDQAGKLGDAVKSLNVGDGASKTADAVKDGASKAVDTVSEGASKAADTVSDGASKAADTVSEGAKKATEAVGDGAKKATDAVKNLFKF